MEPNDSILCFKGSIWTSGVLFKILRFYIIHKWFCRVVEGSIIEPKGSIFIKGSKHVSTVSLNIHGLELILCNTNTCLRYRICKTGEMWEL